MVNALTRETRAAFCHLHSRLGWEPDGLLEWNRKDAGNTMATTEKQPRDNFEASDCDWLGLAPI